MMSGRAPAIAVGFYASKRAAKGAGRGFEIRLCQRLVAVFDLAHLDLEFHGEKVHPFLAIGIREP